MFSMGSIEATERSVESEKLNLSEKECTGIVTGRGGHGLIKGRQTKEDLEKTSLQAGQIGKQEDHLTKGGMNPSKKGTKPDMKIPREVPEGSCRNMVPKTT